MRSMRSPPIRPCRRCSPPRAARARGWRPCSRHIRFRGRAPAWHCNAAAVQRDRLRARRRSPTRWRCVVLLAGIGHRHHRGRAACRTSTRPATPRLPPPAAATCWQDGSAAVGAERRGRAGSPAPRAYVQGAAADPRQSRRCARPISSGDAQGGVAQLTAAEPGGRVPSGTNIAPTSTASKWYFSPQNSQPTSTRPCSATMPFTSSAPSPRASGRRARASRCRRSAAHDRRPAARSGAAAHSQNRRPQQRVAVERQQFVRAQRRGEQCDAVEVLVAADALLAGQRPAPRRSARRGCPSPSSGMRWISSPAATRSSAASTSRVSSRSTAACSASSTCERFAAAARAGRRTAAPRPGGAADRRACRPGRGVTRSGPAVHVEQRLELRSAGTSPLHGRRGTEREVALDPATASLTAPSPKT